jgi:hypothetical protein
MAVMIYESNTPRYEDVVPYHDLFRADKARITDKRALAYNDFGFRSIKAQARVDKRAVSY